jgi:hypothetical protein
MLIGISGKIGSGKDTVALMIKYLTRKDNNVKDYPVTLEQYLAGIDSDLYDNGWGDVYEHVSTPWKVMKFAGKLKQIVSLLTGIPVGDLEKQEVKDRELSEEWWYYTTPSLVNSKISVAEYNLLSPVQQGWCKLYKLTVRQLLQQLGTDAMRDVIHPNIHVNALFADYKPEIHRNAVPGRAAGFRDSEVWPNWLLSDMRFPNELEAVEARGGITIRVNRKYTTVDLPGGGTGTYTTHVSGFDAPEHPSETALDTAKFKHTINNDGSLEDLLEQVRQILLTEKII